MEVSMSFSCIETEIGRYLRKDSAATSVGDVKEKNTENTFVRFFRQLARFCDRIASISSGDDYSDADIYTDVGLVFRENFLEGVCRQIDAKCVLDLGSGDGYHAIHLSRSVETVVAVDRDRVANKILY